jgi:hypothetical protein
MEYDFTLKFKLAGRNADEVVECLGEAGCNDALVGIGQSGRIALNFTREADSAYRAVVSALIDVKKAIPQAKLVEVAPDFVGLTDVAELIDVSRQNMRKLMLTHPDSFPAPIHEGSAAFWHLAPLLQWLENKGGYHIEKSLLQVAHAAMQVNLVKETEELEIEIQNELQELVA